MAETSDSLSKLLAIMDALRDPTSGCPWDLEQDFLSIAKHTIEEVYEVVDAIENGSPEQLKSELGDLLFQVVFYSKLGKEQGLFNFGSIAEAISEKLLSRHPHVFPDGTLQSAGQKSSLAAADVAVTWEKLKAEERGELKADQVSCLDDVPLALSALLRANKLQKRAANQGFDWDSYRGVFDKIKEEIIELDEACASGNAAHIEDEFGDVLFSMVNLGRHLQLDSETSLRLASHKFETRFRKLEKRVREDGLVLKDLSLEAMEEYWRLVKLEES